MKKITLFLLLISFSFVFTRFSVNAEAYDALPLGKNYLNLSNLVMKSDTSGYAYSRDLIRIKANQQYTIVLDYGFLGQHADWIGDINIEFEEYPSGAYHDLLLMDDRTNSRAYIEFTSTQTYIDIIGIPMLPENYNAIMYEGAYIDFPGFEPYVDVNDQVDYYGVLPVDYDQPMTLEEVKSYIHAEDPNGNLISVTTQSDSYTSGSKLPGAYQMVFLATCNQIAKRYHLEVRVFDQSSPVIADPGIIQVSLSEKPSVNDIKQSISVTDNVDIMSSSDLTIIEDTYTAATTLGSYSITVEAIDSSSNISTRTVTINLIDTLGPVITGPSDIFLYTSDAPLTSEQIKAFYTFVDNVDGTNVTVLFSIDTYLQTQLPGVYRIEIKAIDQTNNYRRMNIDIHVIENRGPVFSTDEIILNTSTAQAMTEQELIDWFTAHTLSIGFSISHVNVLYNEYESNENKGGNYYVYLNYVMNGEEQTSRVRVDVEPIEKQFNYITYLAIGVPSIAVLVTLYIIKRKNK